MARYRYFTTDLRTGALLADLPLTNVAIEDELNEVGSMQATIDLFAADVSPAQIKAVTLPARTAIYVATEDSMVWGGIIWKRRMREHSLELVCSGFLSWFSRIRITSTLTFAQQDQFDIARSLLQHALGKDGGDIDVDLGGDLSGVLRDRTYLGEDRKPVLEAVQELGDVNKGFDLTIRAEFDDTATPVKRLVLGFPHLGRPSEGTPLLLEYPGNITDWDWPEEGDRMITTAFVRGELTGTALSAPFAEITDQSLITAGYPRLEEEFSASDGTIEQTTLNGRAQAMLDQFGHPVTLPNLTIASGAHYGGPHPTDFSAGDWVRVRITDPQWFPAGQFGEPGFDGHMRVVRRSIRLNGGDGGESTALTVNPLAVE